MTRNLIEPETAELNRGRPGGWTFNAAIPPDLDGTIFVVVAIRLGDHAHLDVRSGRQIPAPLAHLGDYWPPPTQILGAAGKLILRWDEWLVLRGLLDAHDRVLIREVESPTEGNLRIHV